MTHPVITAIEQRISTNRFDATRDMADAEIERLVSLATRAPTAFNLQNWRFVAVRTPEAKARLRALAWDQPKVTEAAAVLIVVGELADAARLPERLAPSVAAGLMSPEMAATWAKLAHGLYADSAQIQRDEAIRSASLGAATLMLAAQGLGLSTAPMTGFDPAGVASEFGLADNEVPVMLVAVGYAAPGNWPQKPRRPVDALLAFA